MLRKITISLELRFNIIIKYQSSQKLKEFFFFNLKNSVIEMMSPEKEREGNSVSEKGWTE